MVTNSQRQTLLAQISKSRLLSLAADLDAIDRLPGGPGLERCFERAAESLRPAAQVEVASLPTGPEHHYFSWSVERRPFTEHAELWLQLGDGRELPICRAADNPASCMGALRATAAEGDLLEVVDVGLGTRASDYRSHRMPGKLALASGHHFQAVMLEALATRHADGLLCGPGSEADPDRVVPNRLGDPSLFGSHRPFGFNLTLQQWSALVNRLAAEEPVWARVRLGQTLETGRLPLVSAVLEGSDLASERVLLAAELGPDGGALAAACLREAMQAIAVGVVAGEVPPLRRSLQLLLVPGPAGLVAWLAQHRELLPRVRAALFLTLPGAPAGLRLHAPPPSRASFLPDLVEDHLRWAGAPLPPFRVERPLQVETPPYAPGSPVFPLVDRDVGVPALWLCGHAGEPGHPAGPPHALQLLTSALAGAALDLCTLQEEDLPRLACSSHCKGLERLARRAERLRALVQQELRQPERSSTEGRHLLWQAELGLREGLRREQATALSCGQYLSGPGQQALRLAEASSDLEQITEGTLRALHAEVASSLSPRARLSLKRRPLSAIERRASAVVVQRTLAGPLPLPNLLREVQPADREWLAHNDWLLAGQPVGEAALEWVDGERTLLDIYDRLCLDYPEADLRLIWRYLEALQGAGFLRLEESQRVTTPDREGGEP